MTDDQKDSYGGNFIQPSRRSFRELADNCGQLWLSNSLTMKLTKFVINLKDRTDRRVEMERQLVGIGWQAEFTHSDRPVDAAGFPSLGARGCFMNHLGVLRRASAIDAHMVIMEDDLNFKSNFSSLWEKALVDLEGKEWSMFYPAHTLDIHPNGLAQVAPTTGIMCSHFLVVNKNAVQTLITGLEAMLARPPGDPLGGPMHVDGAYSVIRKRHPELKTYAFAPSLGYQRSSRSDVADLRFFDRSVALRPFVSALRKLKQTLS
jgi:glycosyl transferase family 25